MSYDNYHLNPVRARQDISPPRIVVRAADDAVSRKFRLSLDKRIFFLLHQQAFVIGTHRPSSSKTRVLNWRDPILQACAAGDSRSLKIMWREAQASVDERTIIPTPDEMFLAAITEGRIPILKDIHDLAPEYEWSDQVFAEAMKSDLDSGGNHYLLGVTRWSRDPLRVHGEHGDTLMWAVRLGAIETAVVLLSWGASPNSCKVSHSAHSSTKSRKC
jgi:hypothetical protein